MMKNFLLRMTCLMIGFACLMPSPGCSTAPDTRAGKSEIESEAAVVLNKLRSNNPELITFLNGSSGYAVFPSVGKGAAGIGGAYGKGVLYQNGSVVGYCDLSQATIGFQLGGQAYSEIIAYETPQNVQTFKEGRLRFDAQATAVALKSGAGANAKFTNGVAVFTMDEAGLMYEASIGGQQFSYVNK